MPDGQITARSNSRRVQPLLKKYSYFPKPQISCISLAILSHRGAFRERHERGAGCGGRGGALDGRCLQRTAKTCGPDTPTLVSSLRSDPRNDGGKKADHRGERGISRKPLRAGMSGVFRWLAVNTRVHTYYPMRTRGCGCIGHPAFPTPSVLRGGDLLQTSGVSRREIANVYLIVIAETFWRGCLKIESVVARRHDRRGSIRDSSTMVARSRVMAGLVPAIPVLVS